MLYSNIHNSYLVYFSYSVVSVIVLIVAIKFFSAPFMNCKEYSNMTDLKRKAFTVNDKLNILKIYDKNYKVKTQTQVAKVLNIPDSNLKNFKETKRHSAKCH